ncbi:hypothetical protein K505DRAFT_397107 [Melanomma pulvis-pyrius CBS 109.77]|uniref:Uncharacterized protein n=1 Tax=Melanomma pulvis-pyrius CBS 109.77 TaxID=1314802 RepID=A0A6A6WSY7_9PLEO|nr:hypothetical protein K505DRAFT_397107 [Melanomma pulvis-pyrius CBS 109.77]
MATVGELHCRARFPSARFIHWKTTKADLIPMTINDRSEGQRHARRRQSAAAVCGQQPCAGGGPAAAALAVVTVPTTSPLSISATASTGGRCASPVDFGIYPHNGRRQIGPLRGTVVCVSRCSVARARILDFATAAWVPWRQKIVTYTQYTVQRKAAYGGIKGNGHAAGLRLSERLSFFSALVAINHDHADEDERPFGASQLQKGIGHRQQAWKKAHLR